MLGGQIGSGAGLSLTTICELAVPFTGTELAIVTAKIDMITTVRVLRIRSSLMGVSRYLHKRDCYECARASAPAEKILC
jgi:hypothetical protein